MELARRYLSGTATEKEVESLHDWYDTTDKEEIEVIFTQQREQEEDVRNRILKRLNQEINQESPMPQIASDVPDERPGEYRRLTGRTFWWVAAAAVIVAVFTTGGYFLYQRRPAGKVSHAENIAARVRNDLSPGGNKAKLLLGDGSVVTLEDTQNGTIKEEAGTRIDKKDGQLIYDASTRKEDGLAPVFFNTIETPRGGEYQVILPDGSKVWLNAASSLRYPTAFTGKDRHVELKGEAYFEVAENKDKPFTVGVNDMRVEVLGTHFNVMAYEDEHAIKTTLLEGAVKVSKGSAEHVLKTGQEASLSRETGAFSIGDADEDEAVAWKNGFFQFEGASIETVMRQIARWYDVDVEYTGPIAKHFRGMISRSVNVSEVFEMLELTGEVHFRIAGRKIIVMP